MECEHIDSSEESSGSLPDLDDVFKVNKAAQRKESTEINKGDIVWAKFKHLYWPALVRAIYPKQKKISIWYADEPGKTFKLPLKNVCNFNDTVKRKKILDDVKKAGCFQAHDGLTSHATRYLLRRYEGHQDDPMKFFDQTYPFFLVEEMRKKDPNADVSNIKIPPLYISHDKKQCIRKIYCSQKESDDSEVQSTDSEGVSDGNVESTDYLTKVHKQLQKNPCDPSKEEYSNELVEVILSGQADEYLQKVLSKKIRSQHRDNYEKSIKSRKASINNETFTGPIEDDNKLREIIFYLLPLYDSMKGKKVTSNKRKGCRKRKKAVSTSSFNEKSDEALYVSSVWLPEAIIFAISKVKSVSLPEAKQLFSKKCESKTKAIADIISSLKISQERQSSTSGLRKIDTAESFSLDERSSSKLDSNTKAPVDYVSPTKSSPDDLDVPSKISKLSDNKKLKISQERQSPTPALRKIDTAESFSSDESSSSKLDSNTKAPVDCVSPTKTSSDYSDVPSKISKLSDNKKRKISQERQSPTPALRKIDTAESFSSDERSSSKLDSNTKAPVDYVSPTKTSFDDSDVPSKISKLSDNRIVEKGGVTAEVISLGSPDA